jgi:hypothetical protein
MIPPRIKKAVRPPSRMSKLPTKNKKSPPSERKNLNLKTRTTILTEAGYRCAVPTCRGLLAMDLHHMHEVSEGGGDDPSNLIALCPTCHALYHRGTISRDSIYSYKAMLIALSRAFDARAVDQLLLLSALSKNFLIVSGDGLLHFAGLIAAGLATAAQKANNNNLVVTYAINVSPKGQILADAWRQGDRSKLSKILSGSGGDGPRNP